MDTPKTFADVTSLVDKVVREECADAGQITLGRLIDRLKAFDRDKYICFRFGRLHPGSLRSYRGFYDHLAIAPTGEFRTVGEFLDHAQSILGTTMCGYKGGDFVMGPDTPVWVAMWGDTSDTRVTGFTDDEWVIYIETIERE